MDSRTRPTIIPQPHTSFSELTSPSHPSPPPPPRPQPTSPLRLKDERPPPLRKKASTWLTSKTSKLTSWLATSEPSSHALTQHRKDSFARAGLSPADPEPHTKLRAPIGDIPATAIRPATGPRPEEVLMKKAEERRKRSAAAATRRRQRGGGAGESERGSEGRGRGGVVVV
ncbi:hypothetical protein NEMBOFW57_002259 [Staphylotrichum longicolle]|uniref:Uncharacterized protein n=1 Tax=Staphylotrichum longicolle TaxID=669026 RepID=A0AAD4F3Q3_9PEZI|nr:hypothetical protein NEMBOFW57_002259 [Staphylotrichum longicolle]